MKAAPLLVVLLPLLFGGCGKKDPVAEVTAVEEIQQEVKPVDPNFKYEIEGGAVTITDCDKKVSGALSIPAVIEGKPVTSIGVTYGVIGAFDGCESLTSVIIPDSVTSIGKRAFFQCKSLTSITIGDSVTSIGENAFSDCTSLTSITIPDGVTSIGGSAFADCARLTSITIPDGVTSIGTHAFLRCTSLTSITIGDSVTSIGTHAFYLCTSLTSITIPNSVTRIGGLAFFQCKSLTSITIGDSVTSIGVQAFWGCSSLTTIEVGAGNVNYTEDNGVLFNTEKTVLLTYPAGKTGANYNIPDSVTSIGNGAFGTCTTLTSITIPDSVTSIGENAFYFCTTLTSITIPDSVTSIGSNAFEKCGRLTAVTFLGDAPKQERSLFLGAPIAGRLGATSTVYRKPEAKGWGETFGGRPVKLISEKP